MRISSRYTLNDLPVLFRKDFGIPVDEAIADGWKVFMSSLYQVDDFRTPHGICNEGLGLPHQKSDCRDCPDLSPRFDSCLHSREYFHSRSLLSNPSERHHHEEFNEPLRSSQTGSLA